MLILFLCFDFTFSRNSPRLIKRENKNQNCAVELIKDMDRVRTVLNVNDVAISLHRMKRGFYAQRCQVLFFSYAPLKLMFYGRLHRNFNLKLM